MGPDWSGGTPFPAGKSQPAAKRRIRVGRKKSKWFFMHIIIANLARHAGNDMLVVLEEDEFGIMEL
jgi:hypothetical protein